MQKKYEGWAKIIQVEEKNSLVKHANYCVALVFVLQGGIDIHMSNIISSYIVLAPPIY